ncbi:MAG: hypothetical protein PF636_08855 [Actinomycetota bacterium]|jgi:hypothetical protein|nr:hypothetical protein [Actinomycetota bacterium]
MNPRDKVRHKIHGSLYTVSDPTKDPAGDISVKNADGFYKIVHADDLEVIEEAPSIIPPVGGE